MASKRKREARKRFKEANPDLFPKPEPLKPDPNSKKSKKKSKSKTLKPKKPSRSKHPLRVPGMRPGESCFICKSMVHIAKLCPEKSQWEKNKICLLCRRRGHSLKNCTEKSGEVDKKLCYNCGDSGHALSRCPLPIKEGGTKFASCFICNEQGHISKNCPKNTHGIYPKGGCCKLCGGVTHLARDCPNKRNINTISSMGSSGNLEGGAQGKRTVFHGGDDLDDDFTVEEEKKNKTIAIDSNSESTPVESGVQKDVAKPKKTHGPKVVNFFG